MRSGRSVIARSIASIFSSKSARHSPPPRPRQRFAFEPLESRLLLSADPAAAGSLVVVDGAIGEQAGRFSGAEVLVLDQNRDGLEQITQALAARSGSVSALHIVSHGASGSLALGATTLDAASLEGYQAQLRAWADALTADADILFYGCNVAADEAGIGLIEELSRLSGADIAASTDLTGSADLGGDWELEYATGSIEADAIASSASDLILATVNYDAATDTLTFTADAAQVDAVTITSPVANQLRIAVNADTLVLTGDTAAGFTLNAANNQLDIDTSAALISVFDLLLEDQNDTVNFTNNLANGLGAVSIVGGAGNETVTLNATTLGGNLGLDVETVTVVANQNVDVGANAITAGGSNVAFGGASTVTAATFNAGSLAISTGTVALNAGTTAGALSLSGGVLSGTGDVTVSGLTTLSGGTMTGARSTITQGALTINVNGIGLDAGRLLDVRGGALWSAGTINLNSSSVVGSGMIINRVGSVFDNTFNGSMVATSFGGADTGATALFTNQGTFRKSGAALPSETSITNVFDNSGVVEVLSGRLNLAGGGTHTGSFSGTGTLQFGGGTHELSATTSVTTTNVNFTIGTANVGGTYNITGTTLVNGGTANFTGTLASLGNALIISTGTANVGGADAAMTTFTQSGGTLSGTGNLTVSGVTTLSGGSMTGSGDTITLGVLTINVNGIGLDAGRLLDVRGGALWSAGNINLNSSSVPGSGTIINRVGSVFDTSFNGGMLTQNLGGADNGASALFANLGTFRKTGGTGPATIIGNAFDNSGAVEVQSGVLNFTGTLMQAGTIGVASGATLRKIGGFTNSGTLAGNGTFDVGVGNTLTNAGTIAPGTSPGLLTFNGHLLLTDTSELDFELAGVTRGTQYDAINVTGTATLDGDANISHLGGFLPTEDDAFVVIQAASVIGTFDNVIPPDGFEYTTVYGTDHVTFHVAENEEPVAVNDSYSTAEDTPLIIAGPGLLANDTDPDRDSLTALLGVGPAHGDLELNPDGSFTYTPDLNFFGTDSFTYRAFDGRLPSDLATVSLTITPVNDAPVANNDSVTTNEDFAVTVAVRSNDTDVDFNALTVSQFSQGANGTVALNASGHLVYTPNANFFGTDTFTYRVRDTGLEESNEATVSVTVAPVADFSLAFLTPTGSVGEGAGEATLTLVLTTDTALNSNVTVDLTAPGSGSAILGVDYTFTNPTTLTFLAGSVTGATQSADVTITNERSVETVVETAAFNFGNVSVAGLGVNAGPTIGSHTLSITDNDSAAVAITAPGTTSVAEGGGSANVGVTLTLTTDGTGTEQLDVEVLANLPGNGDYAATAALFSVGAMNGATADVVVTAVNDRRVEQVTESFTGQALSVTSTASASAGTSQTIDVVDNDSASVAITSPGTTGVIEGRTSATVGVTLTLTTDGTVGTEQLDVEVAANLPGNGDYAATGVVFGVGAISGATAGVVVTAVNDRNVEQATESFAGQALSVTSTASASAGTSQTINVMDNDSAAVVITTPGTTSVTEGGGSANVGVALMLTTNGTVGTAQLDVAVAANLPGNADYAATGVVFGVGAISGDAADIAVTAVNDRNVEQATETFAGQALSVTSTANVSASTSQTIEVTDNDSASVAISAPGTTRVTEGGASANVGVTLLLTTDGIGAEQLDVAVAATLPGNGDYAAAAALFDVGAASGATADVVVSAANDVMVEQAVESFAGQALSVGSTANVSAGTSQTIEVADNDTAVYTINDVTVSEADGTLTFTVSLSNPVDIEVAIDVSYADQTATGAAGGVGADYDNDLDQVVFAALDMSDKQVTVAITDDSIAETAETFLASLSTATALGGRSIDVSDTGIGTIANDDANNAPVAVDDTYTTNEDMQLLVSAPGVLGNDTDADLDALTAQLVTGPAHGTLIFGSDGSFVYTPELNFFGSDSFAYRVSDGVLNDEGLVTITVNAVNDAPDAQDDTYTTDEDVALTIAMPGLLANDTDVDSALTAILETGPANGALVLNADGSFTYTPNLNFNGTDSFTYRASDGPESDLATVLLMVNAVNDAPVGTVPGAQSTNEDTALVLTGATRLNVADVDATSLTVNLSVTAGTLTLGGIAGLTFSAGDGTGDGAMIFSGTIASIQAALAAVTYNPATNSTAAATLTLALSDNGQSGAGGTLTDSDSVSISINAVNDAPVAVADSFTTDEDTTLVVAAPGVLANDSDVDNASLTAELVSGPASGTLIFNSDGSFRYTPNANFNGTDSFTYHATDGSLDSAVTTVRLQVNAVNDAPDAADDSYMTDEDVALTIAAAGVLANDDDVDSTLTAILEAGPAHGTLVFNADGSFTYTPNLNFNGTDGFTYRASDGPESDLATVLLTVNAVNDAPDAQDDTYTALEDVVLMVNAPGVLGNDSDVDSVLSAAVVDDVDHGTLSLAADGSFLYVADLNFFGTDTFIYEVSDGQGGTNTATVTITVEAVNDPVLAVDDGATTAEDTAVSVPVVANDEDADGDALFVTDVGLAANGTVTFSGGAVIYTPNANFHGTDTFEYTVSDGEDIDTGLVTVTVTPVNDAPVAVDDMATTDEDVAATIAVLANDQDVDGDGLIVGSVTQGTNGTVTINADGTVRYTPNAGFFGTDLFEYTVSDGQGGTDTGLVTVTVDQADDNDAPVFVEVADRTITEGQEVRFTIVATDADDPAGSLVYSVTSGLPAGATFNAATREFVWVPADEEGNEVTTLRFTVLDPDGATDTMDVVLTVTNAKPTVDAGANQVVGLQKVDDDHGHDHGHKKGEAEVSIKATFNDLGTRDTHTATIDWGDGKVTSGSVSESPFGPPGSTAGANGTVTGSHTYKKAGVYTVKVTVTDDDGASRTDTLTVKVKDPDKHLKARDDEYQLREDGVLQVNAAHGVLKNDRAPGSAPLTARLVEGPDHGALVFNADGSFTYRPDANFHGEDSFWYEFTDGSNVSKAVKVELDVKSDGRREACIDWGGHGGWHGGHHGGGQHPNFVEFLIKLARKFD